MAVRAVVAVGAVAVGAVAVAAGALAAAMDGRGDVEDAQVERRAVEEEDAGEDVEVERRGRWTAAADEDTGEAEAEAS